MMAQTRVEHQNGNYKFQKKVSLTEKSGDYGFEICAADLESWKVTQAYAKEDSEFVPLKSQITFTWSKINVFGKEPCESEKDKFCSFFNRGTTRTKHILKNVSGVAYPGEILVMLGSSGAGKSTLLNCLTFRNLRGLDITGRVCMNGEQVNQQQLAAKSAYVQQDDLFIGCLTVKEHLIFQALLKMESHVTYEQRMERIEEVLKELSLKKCENVQIGEPGVTKGISGGERKRVAFASELLTNPAMLFCDEPTSGLDSFMALNVVQLLKTMAKTGRTVITTLHQPSSELFELFDKICLVTEGRTAFLGDRDEAKRFFSKMNAPCPLKFNPADHYVQTLSILPGREKQCRATVNSICDTFESTSMGLKIKKITDYNVDVKATPNPWKDRKNTRMPYKATWCEQFRAVFWRCWLVANKNPEVSAGKLLRVLFATSLISLIYWHQTYDQAGIKNIDGALLLIINNVTSITIMGVLVTFCMELPLFLREHKDGMYRTDVYFLAKVIADLPIYTLINIFGMVLCYYCIGFDPRWENYLTACLIIVLVPYVVMGVGYCVSILAANIAEAMSVVLIVMVPFALCGGFFINVSSIPPYLKFLSDLSWYKYGYEALLINQWADIKNIACDNSTVCMRNGIEVLHSQGFNPDDLWLSIVALIVMAFATRIIAFFALLYKVNYYE